MDTKIMSLNDLVFGLSIQSQFLPTKIEYEGVIYIREGSMITYAKEDDRNDLLKIDTIKLATGGSVKVVEDVKESNNDALIEKIADKIDYIKDQLSSLESAIDDIDVRYQVEEATSQANDIEYDIDDLETLVNELRGE